MDPLQLARQTDSSLEEQRPLLPAYDSQATHWDDGLDDDPALD